ncbi:hypothetical protein BSZ39_02680 [Bowdeniella nasicola]|uniref:Calcineurin-like phosphoesterase domain-containing protein n=1 Tax=Bowdeniella nasicola TaxID=208480 RepID=A0A1Q5Q4F0_9ACTO|nr:hypothetical protein BSZ39_02680 [Bowdeniella nasicola]
MLIVSLATGWATARVNTEIGPHKAVIHTTASNDIRVGLGPLGSVVLDSPLPAPLGIQIDIHEVPAADITQDLQTQLSANLNAYLQLAENPEAAIRGPRDALIRDVLSKAAITFGFSVMGIAALRLATGGHARRTLANLLRRPGVRPLAISVAGVSALLLIVPLLRAPVEGARRISALADTPFADVGVVGQLGPLLELGADAAVGQYTKTMDFYARADAAIAAQLRPAPSHVVYRLLNADGTRGKAVEASGDDIVTAVFATDLHCNIALAGSIARIADAAGADLIINGGDTTTNGTSAERFCVDAFATAWKNYPVVVSDGNHDSTTTTAQEREVGWHVLAGEALTVGGLRILGDIAPTITKLGQGTFAKREESKPEMAQRLATLACRAPIDLMVVHDPYTQRVPENTGCAPMWISGHVHRRVGPEIVPGADGAQVRYTNASTGRGLKDDTVMGAMGSDAEITILRFDTKHRSPIDYRVVSIRPDASVGITPLRPYYQLLASEAIARVEE